MLDPLWAAFPDGLFDPAVFRDRSGLRRSTSTEVLEYFDRPGFTQCSRVHGHGLRWSCWVMFLNAALGLGGVSHF